MPILIPICLVLRLSIKAQKFKNCISFPLLCGDDDAKVLDVVPPPELHLLLGITNKIFDELNSAWGKDKAYKWAYNQCIVRVEYRGGSMEGNQCQMVLKKAATLCQELPEHLKKFGLALDQFSQVVEGCFSQVLHEDYRKASQSSSRPIWVLLSPLKSTFFFEHVTIL